MKKKKSRKKLLIGAGVLIVVAVGGVSAFGKMSSGEETVQMCIRDSHKS